MLKYLESRVSKQNINLEDGSYEIEICLSWVGGLWVALFFPVHICEIIGH